MKTSINIKRLIWTIFISLYSGLFFYNCFSPYDNWILSYIYTMVLILWLCVEYYEKHFFFQSGFLPFEIYNPILRGIFALFFYSSFVIGIGSIVWWQKYRINLHPTIQIIGIGILICSIFLRRRIFISRTVNNEEITNFYLSIILLIISLGFGYGSYFLMLFTVIIGIPLILLLHWYEQREFGEFTNFVHNEHKTVNANKEGLFHLWQKYLDKKLPARKK